MFGGLFLAQRAGSSAFPTGLNGTEGSFLSMVWINCELPVSTSRIQFTKDFTPTDGVQNIGDVRDRIPISQDNGIKSPIVNHKTKGLRFPISGGLWTRMQGEPQGEWLG